MTGVGSAVTIRRSRVNVYGLDLSDDGVQPPPGFFEGTSSASASAPRIDPTVQPVTPIVDRAAVVSRLETGITASPPLVSFLSTPDQPDNEENIHAGSANVSPTKMESPEKDTPQELSELEPSKLSGKHGYYKARRATLHAHN
jgi:hypothetical protein